MGDYTRKIDEYREHLLTITKQDWFKPYMLTTIGFDEVSEIKSKSIYQSFNKNWISVLKDFNLYEALHEYVKGEYYNHYIETLNCNSYELAKKHKYLTPHFIKNIDFNRIKKELGFRTTRSAHCEDGLLKNFKDVKNKIGRVPYCNEFINYSNMDIGGYYKHYGHNIYEDIIKNYLSNEEFLKYKKDMAIRDLKNRSIGGVVNGQKYGYTEEQVEEEFKRVFDTFYEQHGVYPTRSTFNKISKYNDVTYRKRYNYEFSWNDFRVLYGYHSTNDENVSEAACLNSISKILNEKPEFQKTWKWLKSDLNSAMFVDGYFKDHNLVVEFDGSYHRVAIEAFGGQKHLEKVQHRDALKNKLLKQHNIKLLRIDSRDNWEDTEYLKQRLKELDIIF